MSAPEPAGTGRRRVALAAAAVLLVAAPPFLAATFPPLTDLPQHAAQVRLFSEALRDSDSLYAIQWLTPYGLCYTVLGLAWALVEPLTAARLGAALIAAAWVLAIHLLAWRRGRSPASALLASALVFNHTLYWGFLNFVAGWPMFVVWLLVTLEGGPSTHSRRWRVPLATAGLYFVHALWLAMGLLWLGVSGLVGRLPWRSQLRRGLLVAPVVGLAVFSFLRLRAGGFVSETIWAVPPWARLLPGPATEAALGGLRGMAEPLLLAGIVTWLGLGYLTRRGFYVPVLDRGLLAAALLLFGVSFGLPDKYMNTIEFWQRWWPHAIALAILALPPPRLRRGLAPVAAACMVGLFSLRTAGAWVACERHELTGLAETLAALPPAPRVLGLDYVRRSAFLRGQPFMQTFAYAQVKQGGTLNFSFANFAASLVIFDPPRPEPWTHGLEWFPFAVRRSDFSHFDFVIINGDEATHAVMTARAGLAPVTSAGRWRLYRPPPQAAAAADR